jgi:hypothetical protein
VLKSSKPKGTIPMTLPHMKEDPPFVPEFSEQQAKWFDNKAEWERDFKRSAEAALRKSFPDAVIIVKDFRSLLGEKDENGFDRGYDENDFEIEFQCGKIGEKVGESDTTIERWKVRRVTDDSLRS